MKALIVQPELALNPAVTEAFTRAAFEVEEVVEWQAAKSKLMSFAHDVIVLHSTQNSDELIDVCENYRRTGGQAVLLAVGLGGSVELEEKLLDAGCDAFIASPFRAGDVVIRANSMMKAAYKKPARNETFRIGHITIDCLSGCVYNGSTPVHLCPMEFALLEFLVRHPNQAFTSEALYQRLWDRRAGSSDTVRTHVKTLRRKIVEPNAPALIVSDRRFGYKLVGTPMLVSSGERHYHLEQSDHSQHSNHSEALVPTITIPSDLSQECHV
jgi:two-component system OmpR family response regulator